VRRQSFKTTSGGASVNSAGDPPIERPNIVPLEVFEDDRLTYLSADACDSGLFLSLKQELLDSACSEPLPPPDQEELLAFATNAEVLPAVALSDEPGQPLPQPSHEFAAKTEMEQRENEGMSGMGPLRVPGGLAVTEEGVQAGIANVLSTEAERNRTSNKTMFHWFRRPSSNASS
jgi:hypothetical protein